MADTDKQDNRPVNAHRDSACAVAWSPSGQLITGSIDETVKAWDASSMRLLREWDGHHLGVVSVAASLCGKYAVTSAMDNFVRVIDLESRKLLRRFDAGPVEAWTVAVSPDSQFIAAGSRTGNVNIWPLLGAGGAAAAEDDDDAALQSALGEAPAEKPSGVLEAGGKFTMSVAYSVAGPHVACGHRDGSIHVFDLREQRLLHKLAPHSLPVRSLRFTRDGKTLVTASDDGQVKLIDMVGGEEVHSFTGHTGWVCGVDVSNKSSLIASCSTDRTIKVWDVASRDCVQTITDHKDQVWGVAFHPTEDVLASVSDDGVMWRHKVQ